MHSLQKKLTGHMPVIIWYSGTSQPYTVVNRQHPVSSTHVQELKKETTGELNLGFITSSLVHLVGLIGHKDKRTRAKHSEGSQ